MTSTDKNSAPQPLQQLLRRQDLWRGCKPPLSNTPAIDSGHPDLNAGLLHRGWPLGVLIEVCQAPFHGEWQLFAPALARLSDGVIALLNPPAQPFGQAMIQAGVDLERLVIVEAPDKARFLACFAELARTPGCAGVLGWQPAERFTYTELRKCLLAAGDGNGLCALFRSAASQRQSSPAPLRLFSQLTDEGLAVTLFKQKGWLQRSQPRPVLLPLPDQWRGAAPHRALDGKPQVPRRRFRAPVLQLRKSS